MIEKKFTIRSAEGLHLKPAQSIVQAANDFPETEIHILRDGEATDVKSILDLLSLGLAEGAEIHLKVTGKGAREAIEKLEHVCREEGLI